MSHALRADKGYTGLVAKNPAHGHWKALRLNPYLYSLDELADYPGVDLSKRREPEADAAGLGRNCALFERLRRWAYASQSEVRVLAYKRAGASFDDWRAAVLDRAQAYNDFPNPLPSGEVRAIAKSVAKWTWRHFTLDQFATIQSERGRKGAEKGAKKGGKPRAPKSARMACNC